MKRSGKLLLIDLANHFYRGFHVHGNLSWKGIPTGGVYGVLSQLATLIHSQRPTAIAFCDDTKPYERSKMYPTYKASRAKPSEKDQRKIRTNFDIIYEAIPLLCFPLVKMKGMEADDLMGALAKNHANDYETIVLSSNDKDLLQLLDQRNLEIHAGSGKHKKVWTRESFRREYPDLQSAKDWIHVNALTGGHNGLPGVNGIGMDRALKHYKGLLEGKHAKAIEDNDELLSLSHYIAEIPFPGIKGWEHIRLGAWDRQRYSSTDLVRFLARYGIKVSPSMASAFEGID